MSKLKSLARTGRSLRRLPILGLMALFAILTAMPASASEADLVLPDLSNPDVTFFGMTGHNLLLGGLFVCVLGLLFGLVMYTQLKNMPVHRSMREISELIFETCKTYLTTQGKFILLLELFIGIVMFVYFYTLRGYDLGKVITILIFSLIGIAGSYGVAWFGIRVNTFANSRSAFASLRGKPFPTYAIPLKAGISIGMLLISVELLMMLGILLFVPRDYAGPCFIGFAIGESLGAAVLRIAGGIFTKIADIGSDLMKIVFNIKEDDVRNPGVIADCVGDNAGDSVGPTADGFETYGVTGVALITFILLAVTPAIAGPGYQTIQTQLLVWIFAMRVMMIVTSGVSYAINETIAKGRYGNADTMNFETPLTSLVWLTSVLSVAVTYAASYLLIPNLNGDGTLWWKLSTIISCGTLAGALIPELVKVFTSTESGHVKEVVTASREGGASLNILAGLIAGNFSAYWLGLTIVALMGAGYGVSTTLPGNLMIAPAVFAFGLVAFGFLGMGPVTIAVDSYGPVTDNAQSVFELSTIETLPNIRQEIKKDFGFDARLRERQAPPGSQRRRRQHLQGDRQAGAHRHRGRRRDDADLLDHRGAHPRPAAGVRPVLSLLHPPFLLGLITGGAVIYWFSGASCQAVSTGAYRAVEFIKQNIRLDAGATKASIEDSKKVVAICTTYAQKGMFNIFLTVFFSTLAFACLEPYFFIGYLISIAIFGLYQAIFMANAGGAWDNAKKIVEVELKEKGTPLHAATVVGDTVGDPFKDTSSVAMNPVIKFTTLFGLLAVELAVEMATTTRLRDPLAAVFLVISMVFVWRSFYGMRIPVEATARKA